MSPSTQHKQPHRTQIHHHALASLDKRWEGLWGSFGISVILLGFGSAQAIDHAPEQWPRALALLVLGTLAWLIHRLWLRAWQRRTLERDDWLSSRDQALVASGLLLSCWAPAQANWWWFTLLLAGAYGTWRLGRNARQHWPHWYFMAAREVLRAQRR
jgi:hypothetical protein